MSDVLLVRPERWGEFLKACEGVPADKRSPREAAGEGQDRPGYTLSQNGVAVIPVAGMLLQVVPKWMKAYEIPATGYGEIIDAVAAADADPAVREILLLVDSPGGAAYGVDAAADAIWRSAKRVTAHVTGMCCSAAYWLASQTDWILTCESVAVGCIGAYQVWYDESKWMEKIGIRPVVLRSGEHKGVGYDAITDAQAAKEQEHVDALAGVFNAAVARGRGLDEATVASLATGEVWTGTGAVAAGLADEVATNLTARKGMGADAQEDTVMGDKSRKPAAAEQPPVETKAINTETPPAETPADNGPSPEETAAELARTEERARCTALIAAFAGRDLAFALARIEDGSTELSAKAQFCDVLMAQPQPPAAAGPPAHDGAPPVATAPEGATTQPPADFMTAVAERAKRDGITQEAAMALVAKENPELFNAHRGISG